MSMNRIIKLSSIQGGPFTANNNVVDFDISQDSGAYDLSKSYVNLSCTIDATGDDGSNNGANGIYLPQVKLLQDDLATANEEYYPNVALCRNFKMDCANRGSIVDTRRVDVLRSNLYQYGLSSDEQESKQWQDLLQFSNRFMQRGSIFRDLRKEGSTASRNLTAEIRIPLSELCNFGRIQYYDTHRYGRTRLNLELNLDRLDISQILGNGDAGNIWSQGDTRNEFNDVTDAINTD
jgi:hypothetical protein